MRHRLQNIVGFVMIFLFIAVIQCSVPKKVNAQSENLLINGNAEDEMKGWTDKDGFWGADNAVTPKEGQYFFWPKLQACEETSIYQEVDISAYKTGATFTLSAWLANFDQSPHDQSTITLEFRNEAGKVLGTYLRQQRNPEWCRHAITADKPEGAVKIRVTLTATRFVGSDNDGYFDDICLSSESGVVNKVYITGNTNRGKSGDKVQLTADNGTTKNPADYKWSSSYDSVATVDENGLVTFAEEASEQDQTIVSIYAEDKKTGVIGAYHFNTEIKNEAPDTSSEPTATPTDPSTTDPQPTTTEPEQENLEEVIGLDTITGNLLINGGAEEEMKAWIDKDGYWFPVKEEIYGSFPCKAHDDEYFFWPSKQCCEYTYIYQDVDISAYKAGSWMELCGWLANCDQAPHDQATLQMEFLDNSGKVLGTYEKSQRNPQWCKHVITAAIPKNAKTVRVKLIATRYVGSDNDAYFDGLYLVVLKDKYDEVYVTAKKTSASEGKSIQLTANNGITTKASAYEWFSSYNEAATVDSKGKVTIHQADMEVAIYAKDKSTGITGVIYLNSGKENLTLNPGNVQGFKASKVTKSSVNLSWKQCKGASGYYIYQYNSKTKKYQKIKTISKSTTKTLTVKGLSKNVKYKFKIEAFKKYGTKSYSSEQGTVLSVKTKKS